MAPAREGPSGFGSAEGIQKLVHLARQHFVGFLQLVHLLLLPGLTGFERIAVPNLAGPEFLPDYP